MSWELAASTGVDQCADAAGCLTSVGSEDPDAAYVADADLPPLVDATGQTLPDAAWQTWSWLHVDEPTAEALCFEPDTIAESGARDGRWTWGFSDAFGAELGRVKALRVESGGTAAVYGWRAAPWGLPVQWAPAWMYGPVGPGSTVGHLRLRAWYEEDDCLVEAMYEAQLPSQPADLAMYPQVRRWCGPPEPVVYNQAQSRIVEHPAVSPRTGAEVEADPAAARTDAFGQVQAHRAPFVAECAELAERPFCGSDVECQADELCWWSRCLTRPQWSRLSRYRCHEGEVRYDVVPGGEARTFTTQVTLDARAQDRVAAPFTALTEGWSVEPQTAGWAGWGARARGSGTLAYNPQADQPMHRLVYRITHEWLGEGVLISFEDASPDAPLPDVYEAPPARAAVYVEARDWSSFGGCFEERTSRHVFGPDGGESVDLDTEPRILCAWPDHDPADHAARRLALERCDALWEAGERAEFARACADLREANARTWLRLWQVEREAGGVPRGGAAEAPP